MDENEYRKHYYLDEYVIIAPNRKKREINTNKTVGTQNKKCVFCNNNEPKVYTWPKANKWQIKAVTNKNPSIDFEYSKAYGYQEVIIEFTNHLKAINQTSPDDIYNLFKTFQNRIKYILSIDNIEYLNIFKNVGRLAGATQEHLHSQIWAMPIHPPTISSEIEAINRYYDCNNNCPVCDILVLEAEQDLRVLEASDKSVLLSPYAAKFVYETWLIPTRHFSGFVDLDTKTLKSMAMQLFNYCLFLESMGFDYGIIVHDLYDENGHVYIKVLPRAPYQIQASVEIESGIYINSVSPESVKTEYLRLTE